MAGRVYEFGDQQHPTIFREDPDTVENSVLAFFLDYWRSKRGTRRLPLSSDFIPREVGPYLRWVVLIDAPTDSDDFRYRVVGSSVCEYFLGNGTGKTVRDAFPGLDELADGVLRVYKTTCALRAPTQLSGPSSLNGGIFFPAYDSVYLPYSSDGETPNRIVAPFVFNYAQFRDRRIAGSAAVPA